MNKFDPLKAVHEELIGLNDVLKTIKRREHAAEAAMGQAEVELNAVRKLRGYCQIEVERLQERMKALEESKI